MTIAVAYRSDPYGRAAVDWAVAQSEKSGDPIVLITISRHDPSADVGLEPDVDLRALMADLRDRRGVEIEVRQTVGQNVAESVLFEAEQAGATLIVLGVRPRSPVGKALMGSVAQSILLDATVPVVAVKP